jgi:molybdopterin/thiamine biosynthesis adenylyltransferase
MNIDQQLARTTLLLQIDLNIVEPSLILSALTDIVVVLHAEKHIVETFAGQVAISTAAMLMARSGHKVYINTPDAILLGDQPPLKGRFFHEALNHISGKLISGLHFSIGSPTALADIVVCFGNNTLSLPHGMRLVRAMWSKWSGTLDSMAISRTSTETSWPIGALVAATLAAAEVFKVAAIKLLSSSSNATHYQELFAPIEISTLRLAPEETACFGSLGIFDIISAGAISNAFLYSLYRVPGIVGRGRVFDGDKSDQTNRNRNMLLTSELLYQPKVFALSHFSQGIDLTPINRHFDESDLMTLADQIIVGVDDVPTRWLLAESQSKFIGVGATTHFNSMASVHYPLSGCIACLHPTDDFEQGPVPTVAFVSFLSGLMVAADFLREVSSNQIENQSRHAFMNPLQTSHPWFSKDFGNPRCPACCAASKRKAA